MKLHGVKDTTIAAIGYEPTSSKMTVLFHAGGKHEFSHVTYEQYHQLITAENIGRHYGSVFRGNEKHPCVKID